MSKNWPFLLSINHRKKITSKIFSLLRLPGFYWPDRWGFLHGDIQIPFSEWIDKKGVNYLCLSYNLIDQLIELLAYKTLFKSSPCTSRVLFWFDCIQLLERKYCIDKHRPVYNRIQMSWDEIHARNCKSLVKVSICSWMRYKGSLILPVMLSYWTTIE